MSQLWVIAYDISDHKARKHLHNHLKNYGERVQYSVFECRLDPTQQQQLREQLQPYLDTGDSLRWYPLCHWCENDIDWQGKGNSVDPNEYYLL